MPAHERVRDGVGKHLVKRAMSDALPSDLISRPKQGFGTPVPQWFRGELNYQLERSETHELGVLDRSAVREMLGLHRRRRAEGSFQLWNILNLSVWFDHWIASVVRSGWRAIPCTH